MFYNGGCVSKKNVDGHMGIQAKSGRKFNYTCENIRV